MHLLQAKAGAIADGSAAIDLGQSPGDIVFLSAADTELAALAGARAGFGERYPRLRLANVMHLSHPMSVDGYVDDVVRHARLVIARVMGGAGYWPYGVEQLREACSESGIALALLPGDDRPDAELARLSTLAPDACHRLWQYAVHGGPENLGNLLAYAATLIGDEHEWAEPRALLRAGCYWPDDARADAASLRRHWRDGAPVAGVIFYRAHLQASNMRPVDALVGALGAAGVNALPIYVSSLKDPICADTVAKLLGEAGAELVLNTTGFALSSPGGRVAETPFDALDCPVIQVVLAGNALADWREGTSGLGARDIAMNVALPEIDGRLLAGAVSFKDDAGYDDTTECRLVRYREVPDRVAATAALASAWLRLRRTPASERRVALVLANYPNRDGRLGNGVGLDTPAGTLEALRALARAGYDTGELPACGQALIERLAAGPTNALAARARREGGERYAVARYRAFFAALTRAVRERVCARWGEPESDPFVVDGEIRLAAFRLGNVVVGLQPARGYHIDPVASYHDPDLVPPHGYLAFYAWLRDAMDVHAVVHMGKHGNLEWLPGKSLALSAECFPDVALGPVPHVYPFIVNDPGEGTQAKRRAHAAIIDHLTPPLTRAESYGPLAELERLVDEYYEASGVDPRRLAVLRDEILDLSRATGLDRDCGIDAGESAETALGKLDNHLCELKEMQIRDGLHVFGRSPAGDQLTDLLVALLRTPRKTGTGGDASLIRALAADLGINGHDFDPLDCVMGEPWRGARPAALADVDDAQWRSNGDTVERLELLARRLVGREQNARGEWTRSAAVLDALESSLRPAVERCGETELDGLLAALDGRFVPPGPSGAPTRGRPEVLPTGRNFYSVDTRTVPTQAAWRLGWDSATRLIEQHRQREGAWPRSLALSAWGTANMRTGGDDIAQALALMGVRPTWEHASGRLNGFEILPASVLGRPRVDVTLRISGFFRDAFPGLVDLFDSAARAVAALDETPEQNPLRAQFDDDRARLEADGHGGEEARRRAGFRVFGSMPGAYGAGLQALIDERGWESADDLARAYVAWGGYAYGAGAAGEAQHRLLERRLARVEAVVHNQDNREHDLLDSDDYYQFEGGLAAAVHALSGTKPVVYHNDHSRPERPVVRRLEEEIARVVRARVVNPKWIAGVMRHGYKGAFEMAATVDYLFAFAATTGAVADHHFDAVFDAYVDDPEVHGFLEQANPAALAEMAARLAEAVDRGLWQPRRNAAYNTLTDIAADARCHRPQ
ncbi:MAG: cobaltochelatase subunit CobN [Gammaproteobacteria bacterium]|nr:cobaltochelatase subunit CobN [Gammaproteobacteria bacterium]